MCPLILNTTTQLVCQLANNTSLKPNVAYQAKVLVKNIGFALQNGLFVLNFQPVVTSFAPKIGSVAGGTLVTIGGVGFVQSTTSVQIGLTTYFHDGLNVNISFNSIVLNTNSDTTNNTYKGYIFFEFLNFPHHNLNSN